jgi:SSS family solute:Na+ symporter
MDLYKRHWHKDASGKILVNIGRAMTVLFVIVGCLIAPKLGDPKFKGIFHYIQEFQGYISPGILAAFVFGFIFKRAPQIAGVVALVLCVPVYGFLQWQFGSIAFLNRMAITFVIILLTMGVITIMAPLKEPKVVPIKVNYDMRPSVSVLLLGGAVIAAVITFYIVFW